MMQKLKFEGARIRRIRINLLGRGLSRLLTLASLAILGTVTLGAIFRNILPWYYYLLVLCAIAAWQIIMSRFRFPLEWPSRKCFLLILVIAFILSRLTWILLIPTLPVSDFATFDGLARSISTGKQINQVVLNSLGYPALLGCLYAVFGIDLLVAKVMNITLGALSLLLLYYFTYSIACERVARLAAVLFLIWPTQLAFTSVLASEHLALTLMLAGFYILAKDGELRKLRFILWAGILVGLAYVTRPFSIVALIAAIGFILTGQSRFARKTLQIGVVIFGFLTITYLFSGAMAFFYKVRTIGFPYQVLLMGTNFDSEGRYNIPDSIKLKSYPTLDEAHKYAFQESIRRISSRPAAFAILILKKIRHLWGDDSYGVYWGIQKLDEPIHILQTERGKAYLYRGCHTYFIFLMMLAVIGCYRLCRHNEQQSGGIILSLLIIGGAGVVAIMETQSRYHYVLMPAILIYGAMSVRHKMRA